MPRQDGTGPNMGVNEMGTNGMGMGKMGSRGHGKGLCAADDELGRKGFGRRGGGGRRCQKSAMSAKGQGQGRGQGKGRGVNCVGAGNGQA